MKNVSFLKRLLVIVYDSLLLVGVTMVGYALLFALFAITPQGFETSLAGKAIKVIYLLVASFVFYGWFWTHGGQTLGMKVWNLYLVDGNGKFISWTLAAKRYAAALISWGAIAGALFAADFDRWYLTIGIGFCWMVIDKNNNAWHDILTGTRILQMPKTKRKTS